MAGGGILFSVQWIYDSFANFSAFCLFVVLALVYYLKSPYSRKNPAGNGKLANQALFTISFIYLLTEGFFGACSRLPAVTS